VIYTALIGDIVKSRSEPDRMQTQRRLRAVLEDVNTLYESELASRFMITIGDEFQGLLRSGGCVLNIIDHIERSVYPTRIRFGIGVGEILTDISYEMPLGADGPAYHHARAMIDRVRAAERRQMEAHPNVMIKIGGDERMSGQINICLLLLSALKDKWNDRRLEVINTYIQTKSQKKVAETLGITQSAVHQFLAETSYFAYEKALGSLTDLLSEQGDNTP